MPAASGHLASHHRAELETNGVRTERHWESLGHAGCQSMSGRKAGRSLPQTDSGTFTTWRTKHSHWLRLDVKLSPELAEKTQAPRDGRVHAAGESPATPSPMKPHVVLELSAYAQLWWAWLVSGRRAGQAAAEEGGGWHAQPSSCPRHGLHLLRQQEPSPGDRSLHTHVSYRFCLPC